MAQKQTPQKGRTTALRDSVGQVWLAGLGALAVAEEEGNKMFRNLMKRGEKIEKTLVKKGEGVDRMGRARLRQITNRAESMSGGMLGRVNSGLDASMTTVLHRLGVPTSREITNLARRVETLSATLAEGTPRRVTVRATTRKTSARKTTARKTTRRPARTRTVAVSTTTAPSA